MDIAGNTGIGLLITDNTKINIGDSYEEVIEKLRAENINYDIPFNKVSKASGILETIINLIDMDVEIYLESSSVVFIKSGVRKETTIILSKDIEDRKLSIADVLSLFKEYIKDCVGATSINIDKFDAKNYNAVVTFNAKGHKIRASILKSAKGELFLNTIRKIK